MKQTDISQLIVKGRQGGLVVCDADTMIALCMTVRDCCFGEPGAPGVYRVDVAAKRGLVDRREDRRDG